MDTPTSAPMHIQIAIDCDDPHLLNRFWSELLGYRRDEDREFVQHMLDEGRAQPDDTIVYDGVLQWRTAAASSDPDGHRPRLLFQHVPEPKAGKNRVHLDLHPPDSDGAAQVERALALG